ncbi:uncharacterized protein JCM6883_000050 [Sporobolomyces salmoneus]|uniref:uncharacterized protein n=1 Tax=Sporobolomyces salmoneus TaxID=183962 RepID=UPI00317729B5
MLRFRPPTRQIRTFSTTRRIEAILGIRKEDPARTYERRAPLCPDSFGQLIKEGHEVVVEKSGKRIYRDQSYQRVGAKLVNTLDSTLCDVVVGVKEPLPSNLVPSPRTTHLGFFHTHKGQAYNLPLLSQLLKSESTIIDYELLMDREGTGGKRTVGFGKLAGFSGMADGVAQLGTKLLASKGSATPFLNLERPLQAGTVERVEEGLRECAKRIKEEGIEKEAGPIIITLSGRGKVGEGAKRVLDQLDVKWVKDHELQRLSSDPKTDTRRIYACHLELQDYLVHREKGKPFSREEYREHPERYESTFHEKTAPYTTLFLNGGFFSKGCPLLLSTRQLADLQSNPNSRLVSIVDVSCDFDGALEFVTSATTLDDPIIQFDAVTNTFQRDPARRGTQISSVEILPSALPLDATKDFSSSLLPYIRQLLEFPSKSTPELQAALERATLAKGGKLEGKHEWLYGLLEGNLKEETGRRRRKRAVVLGAGLVAGPAVRTLASQKNLEVIVASNDLPAAESLAKNYENVSASRLDASNETELRELIANADVVVSLLPAPMHVKVANLCIDNKTSLVTASYTSPEMAALHDKAKEAGIVLLNELGLDPGIDHCSAAALIEEARSTGNEIVSFVSFCGGLPDPSLSSGPLGYKFSWSPRGVLTAALNSAQFRLDSNPISIPGPSLLQQGFSSVPILRGFNLEGIANRDSLAYLPQYDLPSDLPTILRGTLRYPGFSRLVDAFKKIGLLDVEKLERPIESWGELVDKCLGKRGFEVNDSETREQALSTLFGEEDPKLVRDVLETLNELALLPSSSSPSISLPPLPLEPTAPIDLLSLILSHQLAYGPNERDLVILHHELTTRSKETGESELFTSTLVQYGTDQESAMALTVGTPIALGALLILEGTLLSDSGRGIVSPTNPKVWKPLLRQLEANGIRSVEKRKKGSSGMLRSLKEQLKGRS